MLAASGTVTERYKARFIPLERIVSPLSFIPTTSPRPSDNNHPHRNAFLPDCSRSSPGRVGLGRDQLVSGRFQHRRHHRGVRQDQRRCPKHCRHQLLYHSSGMILSAGFACGLVSPADTDLASHRQLPAHYFAGHQRHHCDGRWLAEARSPGSSGVPRCN